ncbi:MAG: MarR family EPS-associated transcriptional regulator [Candidatus Omnitrophota bacterium]|nr:MarR family EPS-associated transcriptional regulator [Candidatus Omnitrophota bacterium]
MFEHPSEETLSIIKEIEATPATTQRIISNKLGISLGKTNYLLKALIEKGLIKVKRFSTNPGKIQKINYYLTKEGLEHKMLLMLHFLKKKEEEYYQIKQEWEQLNGSNK